MKTSSIKKFLIRNETAVVVGISLFVASSLFVFEAVTGLTASVRTPMYGNLPVYGTPATPSRRVPVETQVMINRRQSRANARRAQRQATTPVHSGAPVR